ncbi:MAG: vWA domain-containing protein [Fimbriimonadales bacterium]
MNLANAAALWYLLPLGGIIILLYLLKMRRKDFKVPATFLWPHLTTEVRANSLLQRLKFSWLMVLQLLSLLLIVASLARPQTTQEGLAGTVTVFVLDTSASMSATDAGGTRFDEAIERIKKTVATAQPGDRFSLVEAGPTPRVALPLSGDTARMRDALHSLSPTDTECDIGEGLRLASALVGAQESGHIVLLSDGAFPELTNFSQGKATVHFQQVGQSSDNVAITAIGVGDTPGAKQLFCGVRNFSKQNKTATVSFFADGTVFESKRIAINAGSLFGQTSALPPGAKILEARLDVHDILDSDNAAFTLADPSSALRVLLVTKGNLFLEQALALDPRVTLDKAETVPVDEHVGSPGPGTYDVVVFDGIQEIAVKARGVLTFGAAGSSSIARPTGTIDKPQVTATDNESDLVQYVDLSTAFIDKAEQVEPKTGAQVLVDSHKGALVLASEVGKKQVYVAFSVLNSDFALQIGFPIFISNALDFMGGQATSNVLTIQTGRPVSFPAATEQDGFLTLPNGSRIAVEPTAGSYILRDLKQTGKYRFEFGDKRTTLYASLLSERESNIAPISSLQFKGRSLPAAKATARIADFWRPILVICLAALACEWWLFAKKS